MDGFRIINAKISPFYLVNSIRSLIESMFCVMWINTTKLDFTIVSTYQQSQNLPFCRVAKVRENIWKMNFFPGQGKVREL